MTELFIFGMVCIIGVIYLSTMKELEQRRKEIFEEIDKKVVESENKKWLM